MDLVRFGDDYIDQFDPKAYLNNYYKAEGDEVELFNEFALRSYHEFWAKMAAKKNLRVLDFGGGPSIYDLISAAPYSEEIIFAEYSEKNRQVVEKWLQKSPDSHDWLPYFKFVVQTLEGKKSEDVAVRESELRKKISHVLPCDIRWEDPVEWPADWSPQTATFDVVSTSLCIEAAVKSFDDYSQAIAKLRSYLKPGGYLIMYSVTGESFYTVGTEKFHTFNVTEKQIKDALCKEGFTGLEMKLYQHPVSQMYDGTEIYFVSAQRKI